MKAIQVSAWGQTPTFQPSAADPPGPGSNEVQLTVLASGLHRIVRSQSSGTHYSARSLSLPYIPGMDGVGLDPTSGKSYYFVSMAKGGGFAERINVPKERLVEVGQGADAVQVAGLVNPGMSSWMALKSRVKNLDLSKGWSVVVLGVTTQSGKVAVHFARHLGATRVIGVARDEAKMKALGLDEAIVLKDNPSETDFGKMGDVDVILDYLYGAPIVECLTQLNSKVPTQIVQIGSMAGLECNLPSALLRSKDVTLRGSGPGAWTMQAFGAEAAGLVKAVEGLPKQEIVERGLEDAQASFDDQKGRTVFVPGK